MNKQLYPYQSDAVELIRESYRSGHKSPLFVLPTGGGKTFVFCYIAAQTASREKNVLILVHRVELLRQSSASLSDQDIDHGLINPKYTPDLNSNVQVASVQSLVNRLNKITEPDLIIIDEAHHATAGSWRKIINHFPNAKVLGVTATPCRSDGKGLGVHAGGVFDDIIIGPQIYELIEMGNLVEPVIYAPKTKIDFSRVKIVRGDFDKKQVTEIMDKPKITGSAVQHYRKLCSGSPAIVFCISVAHAEHVAQEFRDSGYKAYSVDGSMDDDTRQRILDGLGDGSVEVVTSCDLISEGTDIPAVECAILLRPTESLGLFIQQIGRALRKKAGKTRAIILDHVGNVLRHGFPTDHREWSLDGVKKRTKAEKEEQAVKVAQCESCYSVFPPAPICPVCGHASDSKQREIEYVDGKLELITPEEKEILKRNQKIEVARAKSLDELIAIGIERGYKSGWARSIYKARVLKKNKNI